MTQHKQHASQVPRPTLQKTLFQLRYKPDLKFYDLLMSAAKKLNEFKDWETTRLQVVLRDYKKHCSVAIAHHAVTYQQDSADAELESTRVGRIISELAPALEIETLTRLGYRRQYLLPTEMSFASAVAVTNLKLLAQHERLRRILPKSVEDILYRIDSKEGENQYHITVAPVRKKEIPQAIVYNRRHHLDQATADEDYRKVVEQLPEVAVFVDIDRFQEKEGIPLGNALPFFHAGKDEIHRMTENVSQYLFSNDLATSASESIA